VDTVREGHLFHLATPTPQARMATIEQREEEDVDADANVREEDLIVWHRKMGHLN